MSAQTIADRIEGLLLAACRTAPTLDGREVYAMISRAMAAAGSPRPELAALDLAHEWARGEGPTRWLGVEALAAAARAAVCGVEPEAARCHDNVSAM